MDIETYLWKYRTNTAQLARKIGCSYQTLVSYAKKSRKPKLAMAERIERCTDGEVTVQELMTGRYSSDVKNDFISSPKPKNQFFQQSIDSKGKISL